jgi:quinol monooxygenase YgiN
MSLPVLIGFAGVLVAAAATGLLAGRCVRQPRIDSILWTAAALALAVALAAQAMGFARGFTPATFRAVQVLALLLAPLWLAWGLAELTWPSDAARFGARLVGSALTVVASVILATDPLTGQPFGKSWPLASAHYQPISHYVLDLVQATAVVTAAVSAGLAAARVRNDRQQAGSLVGIASVGLAVLMTAGLRVHLTARSAYPLVCALAAALVWFGATRTHDLPGRRDRAGRDRLTGGADDYDLADTRYATNGNYLLGDTEGFHDPGGSQGSPRSGVPRGPGAPYGAGAPYGSGGPHGPGEPVAAGGPGGAVGSRGSLIGAPGDLVEDGDRGWRADPGMRPLTRSGQDRYSGAGPAGPGVAGPGPDGLGPDGRLLAPQARPTQPPAEAAAAAAAAGLAGVEAEAGPLSTPAGPPPATPARPYGRILIFTLLDDRAADFDRLAEQTAEEVRTKEPDTLVYVIHLVPNAPMQRIFYEIYRDRAALDLHESQPYMQRFVAERRSYVLATNVIELRLKYAKVAPLPASQPASLAATPGTPARVPPGQAQGARGPRRPQILAPLPPAPLPAEPGRRPPSAERRYGGT